MQEKKIQKQAFWFTVINYLGMGIGVISTIFIYPHNKEFLGMLRFVDAIAQVLFPIMVFGTSQALINFYPSVSEKNQSKLFKYGIFTILLIGFFLLIVLFFGDKLLSIKNYHFVFYAFPLALALAFIELFKRQSINLHKVAVPTFYEKILPKIALPTIFLLLLSGYLEVISALIAFILSYFVIFLLLGMYLFRNYRVDLNFNFKPFFAEITRKEYYRYSSYAFLGSFGSLFAFRIDALMIPQFLSFEANGTFSIGVALAAAIGIPAIGIFTIYAPLVSNYVKENNFSELKKKYVETAKLLFFIGALLYGAILLGIDSLFQLVPTYENLVDSIPVILVLGANVLFNMATGFNSEIISYSKFYRFNILSILILIVLNVGLNLYFLLYTNLGIVGVAIASLIAMTTFNVIKLTYIKKKFGMLPFDKGSLKLFFIMLLLLAVLYTIPSFSNNWVNLVVKVGGYILLAAVLTYKLKLVYSFNYFAEAFLGKIKDK
ncbi:MAG TPA: polysaccharide biosynthesis C-terminal domain-containing protein [Flavobacteriaceae bacterium]|nr:polysaccharide biosynthesis C-terminal domain-containing protein [Flavobacteriaceae bacterium]